MTAILETHGLTKRFGGLVAVNNVSISVERGSITAIIGPNGAGKTTLLNMISGMLLPDKGRVIFEGKDITSYPAHKRARMGIGRSFQNISIFPNLSVLDNIKIALLIGLGEFGASINPLKKLSRYDLLEEAIAIAEAVGLGGKERFIAGSLTQADQRKLDIALAISRKPRLLLLDEPTSGLSVEEIPSILSLIRRLRGNSDPLTIILVEHKIEVVRELADRVIVMKEGSVIAEGPPSSVMNNREVIEAYLGEGYA
ncbi:ABC transporter ATP-binding protein [Desulfurococcaceae archaeon AG1]|jgi:branched-chain amino acid transport system ATP-binding protein|nr:ABC transporter ATP-binding protein [Desulfurococcaceae archaeon AG1]HWQ16793.1 ABC transporter ATP-binding protein [Sulfolobales archaeon]